MNRKYLVQPRSNSSKEFLEDMIVETNIDGRPKDFSYNPLNSLEDGINYGKRKTQVLVVSFFDNGTPQFKGQYKFQKALENVVGFKVIHLDVALTNGSQLLPLGLPGVLMLGSDLASIRDQNKTGIEIGFSANGDTQPGSIYSSVIGFSCTTDNHLAGMIQPLHFNLLHKTGQPSTIFNFNWEILALGPLPTVFAGAITSNFIIEFYHLS